jgi:hypothetical protein
MLRASDVLWVDISGNGLLELNVNLLCYISSVSVCLPALCPSRPLSAVRRKKQIIVIIIIIYYIELYNSRSHDN